MEHLPAEASFEASLEMAAAVFAIAEQSRTPDGWITADAATETVGAASWKDADRWKAHLEMYLRESPKTLVLAAGMGAYPRSLYDTARPPAVLFALGPLARELDGSGKAVAVVGSRDASHEVLAAAQRFGSDLSRNNYTVISGLAAGVDGAAHHGALAVNGRTVAVLGTGIERVFPPDHALLQDQIARHGALVSQFPPQQPASKTTFPARNNVIAGLATSGLIVMDAAERSGTRIAINYALKAGRHIFIWEAGAGQRRWVREFIEQNPLAAMVADADDVLTRIGGDHVE